MSDPCCRIHPVDRQSQIHIHQHRSCAVLPVKAFRQSRYKAYRKFQPLALVNAHNPHDIRVFVRRARFAVINVIFFQLFHVPDKMKQTGITRPFKAFCPRQQHFHVDSALHTSRQRADRIQIARFLQKLLHQLVNRQIDRVLAVAV